MATFEITFTFAIAMPPPKKEAKKKKSTPKKKKQKDNMKDMKDMESQEKDQTTFKIDSKPFEYIHVNYTIIPKKLEYEFDVVIWGTVAKIYTSGVCKALKTFVCNEGKVAWISFSICHHTALTASELTSLFRNGVAFKIECGVKKVGQRAKADKPKLFQIVQTNDGSEDQPENKMFLQLEEVNTAAKPSKASIATEQVPSMKAEKSSLCGYPCAGHVKRVGLYVETYSGVKLEALLQKKDLKTKKDAKSSDKKGKKDKGAKQDKKEKDVASVDIAVPGELFFTDLKEISSEMERLTPTIPYGSVTISVVNLLTEEQKVLLNPTIVRIEKLVCLPATGLLANKYKRVFFKIRLYGDVEIITEERPLAHEMLIFDTHAVILRPLQQKAYLQQLQTGLFQIEIYGTREELPFAHPVAFGEDGNSRYTQSFRRCSASFCHQVKCALPCGKTTLLAVANYDPYLILNDHLNIEDWVKVEPIPNGNQILSEGDLRRCCLKLVVKQTSSLKEPLMQVIARGNHYNRMCLICKNEIQAALVLRFVNEINEGLVPKRTKVSGNPLHSTPLNLSGTRNPKIDKLYEDIFLKELGENPIERMKKNPADSVISGFIFSDQEYTIIFMEGLANGKIQNLIHELKDPIYNGMIVHYHSQLIFEERMYKEYLRQGGFSITVIDEPLHNKVSKNGLTMDGSLDEDVRRTLLNFYRLTKVKDIVEASRYELFPTPRSIANLNTQFGVPMMIEAESDSFVPKRLHFRVVEAPRISEYCGMDSPQESDQEYDYAEYGDEEIELASSSYNSISHLVGSGAF